MGSVLCKNVPKLQGLKEMLALKGRFLRGEEGRTWREGGGGRAWGKGRVQGCTQIPWDSSFIFWAVKHRQFCPQQLSGFFLYFQNKFKPRSPQESPRGPPACALRPAFTLFPVGWFQLLR